MMTTATAPKKTSGKKNETEVGQVVTYGESDNGRDTHVPSLDLKDKAVAAEAELAQERELRDRNAMDLLSGVRSHYDDFLNYGQKSFEEVLAIGERLNKLKDLVKKGLPTGPNTWQAWVEEKEGLDNAAADYLPFGLRQANRYIRVFNQHQDGKVAFDPECFTFASAADESNGSETQPAPIEFKDDETGVEHGKVRWTNNGRFNLSWKNDKMAKRMDKDNVCCSTAILAGKLAFQIVARTKVKDGVMKPMLDMLIKLSEANGDTKKMVNSMKKAVDDC